MATAKRSVLSLPLDEVWDASGTLPLTGGDHLDRPAIEALMRSGLVQLAVAEVGHPLEWVPERERRRLWRGEVSERLLGPSQKAFLGDFNDGYFYRAQAWVDGGGHVSTIVFERHH